MRTWYITFYATALKRVDPLWLACQLSWHNLKPVGFGPSHTTLQVDTQNAEDLLKFAERANRYAGALVFSRIETVIDGQRVSLDDYLQEVA